MKNLNKKFLCLVIALSLCLTLVLGACAKPEEEGNDPAPDANASEPNVTADEGEDVDPEDNEGDVDDEEVELTKVRVAFPPAVGNLFHFIAEDRGFLEEEGLEVEVSLIGNSSDAYTAIDAGQVDFGIYGTSGPLHNIAMGRDFTIFGGYMITGATPIVAQAGTEYEGLESFRGKTIALMRFISPDAVLRSVLVDAGFDLEEDVTILTFKKPAEVLEAVRTGQADFGGLPTGEEASTLAYGLEPVVYTDELWPLHSCCRLTASNTWLAEQPEAATALLRAYIRANEVLDSMSDEDIISFTAEKLGIEEERAAMFIVNEHLSLDIDPYKNVVLKMWDKMDDIYPDADTSSVDIEEHINIELYKAALDELSERYPDNEYYKERQEVYAEFNH